MERGGLHTGEIEEATLERGKEKGGGGGVERRFGRDGLGIAGIESE